MAQPTHRNRQAQGRLARTADLAVQLAAQDRVGRTRARAAHEARALVGTVLELVDQLKAERDPSERIVLQETARDAAGRIVTLLDATGTRVATARRSAQRSGLGLDQAMELLDGTLLLAEVGLTGGRHLALELALIVRDGVDGLVGVEPAGELVTAS